jgi:RHS repeat-associated protein
MVRALIQTLSFNKVAKLLLSVSFLALLFPVVTGAEALTPQIPQYTAEPLYSVEQGTFNYSYSLGLPQVRSALPFDVSLNYKSDRRQEGSPFGFGWDINIPYIERENKRGVDRLLDFDYINSNLAGPLATTTNLDVFVPRFDDGSGVTFKREGLTWKVYAKSGFIYEYGSDATARIQRVGSSTQVMKWYITKVTDSAGNVTSFEYTQFANEVYPIRILLHSSSLHVYEAIFELEDRLDTVSSYRWGIQQTLSKRIKNVRILHNNELIKIHTFVYGSGVNGVRSLLTSINQTAYASDGSSVSLAPETFEYNGSLIWGATSTPNYLLSSDPFGGPTKEYAVTDFNGDGQSELSRTLVSSYNTDSTEISTYGSNGQRQIYLKSAPDYNSIGQYPEIPRKQGLTPRLVDVNGDGLTDGLLHREGIACTAPFQDISFSYLGINSFNGTSFLLSEASSTLGSTPQTTRVTCPSGDTHAGYFSDVNGDGIADYVYNQSPSVKYVYIGNADGTWTLSSTWNPLNAVDMWNGGAQTLSMTADVNNDGLQDYIYNNGGMGETTQVSLNIGNSWASTTSSWSYLRQFDTSGGSVRYDPGVRILDINGDDLPDIVRRYQFSAPFAPGNVGVGYVAPEVTPGWNAINEVYINTGSSWVLSSSTVPSEIVSMLTENGYWFGKVQSQEFVDISGDGLLDIGALSIPKKPDMLKALTDARGLRTEIEYTPTPQQQDQGVKRNPKLSYVLFTPTTVTQKENGILVNSVQYEYVGGKIFYNSVEDRGFAGFSTITKSDRLGKTVSYYHQGDGLSVTSYEPTDHRSLQGREYRSEYFSDTGLLQKTETTTWAVATATPNSWYVRPQQKISTIISGGSPATNATQYEYDLQGNMVIQRDLGEVLVDAVGQVNDVSGDTLTSYYSYASSTIFLGTSTIATTTASSTINTALYSAVFDQVPGGPLQNYDGWSATPGYIVDNAVGYGGVGRSVKYDSAGEGSATRMFAGQSRAQLFAYIRKDVAGINSQLLFTSAGSYKGGVGIGKNGNQWIVNALTQGGVQVDLVPVQSGEWIKVQMDIIATSSQFRVRINDGVWSQYFNTIGVFVGGMVDGLRLEKSNGGTGALYWDSFAVYSGSDTQFGQPTSTATTTVGVELPLRRTERVAPSRVLVLGSSSSTVAYEQFYYDNLPSGAIGTGTLTMLLQQVATSTFATTSATYNQFGQKISETNARFATTTFTFDPESLYVATQTNALGQSLIQTYDFTSQNVVQQKDANAVIQKKVLDGHGRVVQEWGSSPVDGALVQRTQYVYNDAPGYLSIEKRTLDPQGAYYSELQYLDARGQVVQTKQQMATGFATIDSTFDTRGREISRSAPYITTSSACSAPTANTALVTYTSYDALNRPTAVSNFFGTTQSVYSGRTTSVTDVLGKLRTSTVDARGQLVSVTERIGTTTLTTSYAYMPGGQLATTTDSLGNIRRFTYDLRGLRLSAEDLHYATDTAFGMYQYAYDVTGNKISQVAPDATSTVYTYDLINRVTSEDALHTPGTDVTYSYDTCLRGVGKLCSAARGTVSAAHMYSPSGSLSTESRTIGSTSFTKTYAPDAVGRIMSITYPDLSRLEYTYTSAGQVSAVKIFDPSASTSRTIISDILYAPTGALQQRTNGNGTFTCYTYDPSQLYRLTQKTTTWGQVPCTQPTLATGTPVLAPTTLYALPVYATSTPASSTSVVATTSLPIAWDLATGTPTTTLIASTSVPYIAYFATSTLTTRLTTLISSLRSTSTRINLIEDVSYLYDAVGNPLSRIDRGYSPRMSTSTYAYDDLYRLTAATTTSRMGDFFENYTYNPVGNILSYLGTPYQYTTNTSSYLNPHAPQRIGTTTLAYDQNGNTLFDGTRLYSWTPRGEVSRIQQGTTTSTYLYDFLSSRMLASSTLGTTTQAYGTTSVVVAAQRFTFTPFTDYTYTATLIGTTTLATSSTIYLRISGEPIAEIPQRTSSTTVTATTATTSNQTYDGSFDSLALGTLTTQDSWIAPSPFILTATYTQSGARALIYNSSPEGTATRSLPATSRAQLTFSIRKDTASLNPQLYFTSGGVYKGGVTLGRNGSAWTLAAITNNGTTVDQGTFTTNTWINIQLDIYATSSQFRIKVNNGSWSPLYVTYPIPSGTIDGIRLDKGNGGTGNLSWDSLTLYTGSSIQISTSTTYATTTSTLDPTLYLHTDHLNTTTLTTDSTGRLSQSSLTTTHGKRLSEDSFNSTKPEHLFIGERYDYTTDLSYLNARYYSPQEGTFISEDPVHWEVGLSDDGKKVLLTPQSQNSYSYGNGNPERWSDPSGRFVSVLLSSLFTPDVVEGGDIAPNGQVVQQGMNAVRAVALAAGLINPSKSSLVYKEANAIFKGVGSDILGKVGEAVAGASKFTKGYFTVNGRNRVTDISDPAGKVIGEVKNVAYQSLTTQLKDSLQIAQNLNYEFKLFIRESTQLSKPLQQWIAVNGVKVEKMSNESILKAISSLGK